jgi:hypothetical protein
MTPAKVLVAFAVAAAAAFVVRGMQPGSDSLRDYEETHLLNSPVPNLRDQRPARRDPAHTLDDFHDAAAKADFVRYFAHWTAKSVFLGTDATERWVGEAFKTFAKPHFDKGTGWTYKPRDRKVTQVNDSIAFFDELLDHDKLGTCRGSGMLRLEDGNWKILQYNLSIPIPNDKAADVAALITGEPKK